MEGREGSRAEAETAELLGVSMNCVRDGAEAVRPKDDARYEDEEDPDSTDQSEEAMTGE